MIRDSIASACIWLWITSLIVAVFLPRDYWAFDCAAYSAFAGFVGYIVAMSSR
jgi:hypothetical protein